MRLTGGDTIRQIQVQSGAHVELHRGTQPNPDEKLFNVRGNSQQIQLAQQLIRQKYENVPGAGGSPQYGPGYVCVCVLYNVYTLCKSPLISTAPERLIVEVAYMESNKTKDTLIIFHFRIRVCSLQCYN